MCKYEAANGAMSCSIRCIFVNVHVHFSQTTYMTIWPLNLQHLLPLRLQHVLVAWNSCSFPGCVGARSDQREGKWTDSRSDGGRQTYPTPAHPSVAPVTSHTHPVWQWTVSSQSAQAWGCCLGQVGLGDQGLVGDEGSAISMYKLRGELAGLHGSEWVRGWQMEEGWYPIRHEVTRLEREQRVWDELRIVREYRDHRTAQHFTPPSMDKGKFRRHKILITVS